MHVEVAAWGWLGKPWAAAYPDDLPEEWRLDYYANEYDAVVVPSGDWRGQESETLQQWLDEAPEGFRFYWAIAGVDPAPLPALYRDRSDSAAAGGWLFTPDGSVKAARGDLTELAPLALGEPQGEYTGNGLKVLAAEKEADLRRLRERLDMLAAQGTDTVLLTVHASADASERLRQLHTLCQLYCS